MNLEDASAIVNDMGCTQTQARAINFLIDSSRKNAWANGMAETKAALLASARYSLALKNAATELVDAADAFVDGHMGCRGASNVTLLKAIEAVRAIVLKDEPIP
jgi:hypothetical protein